jgi:hypothetical protein
MNFLNPKTALSIFIYFIMGLIIAFILLILIAIPLYTVNTSSGTSYQEVQKTETIQR